MALVKSKQLPLALQLEPLPPSPLQLEALALSFYRNLNAAVFGNQLPPPHEENCSEAIGAYRLKVTWNTRLLTTAGRAIRRPAVRQVEIQLSTRVLDTNAKLWSTLAHEMCHAAVWLIDERVAGALPERNHHGQRWRVWVTAVTTQFPGFPTIEVCHRYAIDFGHTYHCRKADCGGWTYGSCRPLPPRALQAYRCSLCRGPLVISEGTTTGAAPVSHIRSARKAIPAVRAWHLFRKRHADRCRHSPSEQAGLVLWYLGLEPRRDLVLWAGGPRGRVFLRGGLSALWQHIRTHAPRVRARYEAEAAMARVALSTTLFAPARAAASHAL
jgi:predicted SprT family Zn-dependent metalloprotease